jgi:hypothetical protein
VQEEGAAADAGALRLHEVEHELHRDGRVRGAAAGREDRPAGLRGEGIGGRHHVARGGAGLLGGAARGGLGRGRRGLGRRRQGRQGDEAGAERAAPVEGWQGHCGLPSV